MTTAQRFTGDVNARNVLIRLGEHVPTTLTDEAILDRYMVDANAIVNGTIRFKDGSTCRRDSIHGWYIP